MLELKSLNLSKCRNQPLRCYQLSWERYLFGFASSMSDRVSCWYFSCCVLVGSSSNADVDFSRWCFSCDGQQRVLRDFEAMTFCGQEPAVGFARVFLSGFQTRFLGTPFVVIVAQNIEDARASGNTALSSHCWDLLSLMRRVVNYHSSWVGQRQVELFDASGIRVWCKDERVYQVTQLVVELARLKVPQEVVRVSQLCIVFLYNGITAGGMSRVMIIHL
ncbi:pentatricopeptide repeat-containing protein [Dorcoceras hygrometricum]|uniref:Pentatricopeptide repeat-containing protein n=1 Tax=Dorcoceras hygrometricum TaxID=472368 RepID=A0A2Z7DEP3_9LAMI|nr:pentatricopeptide repeat-containing protein [Dorcoceras hygrometricum]